MRPMYQGGAPGSFPGAPGSSFVAVQPLPEYLGDVSTHRLVAGGDRVTDWWSASDGLTRAAAVATGAAVVLLVIPLFSAVAALVGAIIAGVAVRRARRSGIANRAATWCLALDGAILAVLVVGNAVYSANS